MKNKNELTTQMQRVVENIREPIDTMTIRDQFAMAAMQGLMAVYWESEDQYDTGEELIACHVETAYEYADAMLAERDK